MVLVASACKGLPSRSMLSIGEFRLLELPSAGSTNSYVAAHQEELSAPTWVIAERQLQGRGQGGHVWLSRLGDFSASLLYRPERLPSVHLFLLSELVSLAIADMLGAWGYPAQVKWPNDILLGGRKACGILIETSLRGAQVYQAILGVGLNIVHWPLPPGDLAFPVTTLADCRPGVPVPTCEQVATAIVEHWNAILAAYPRGISLEGLARGLERDYLPRLWHGEGLHRYRDGQGTFLASVEGLAPHGALRLRLADGSRRTYAFGTLRQLPDE